MAMRKNNVPTKMILFPQSSQWTISVKELPNLRLARLKALQIGLRNIQNNSVLSQIAEVDAHN